MSSLFRLLESDAFPAGYWIAADDAYVCGKSVITPHSGRCLSTAKDCFNYFQSSARIRIELAFGQLVGRFGILWRPLRTKVRLASLIVVIVGKLHNFIIDNGETASPPNPLTSDVTSHGTPAHLTIVLQDEADTDDALHRRRRDLETCELRETFTNEIAETGLERPRRYIRNEN
jgi:DDE superfamily endonuclease